MLREHRQRSPPGKLPGALVEAGATYEKAAAAAAAVIAVEQAAAKAGIAAVRTAGFADAQVVEIIALVAENSITNYLNEAAKTEIDFPVVRAANAA